MEVLLITYESLQLDAPFPTLRHENIPMFETFSPSGKWRYGCRCTLFRIGVSPRDVEPNSLQRRIPSRVNKGSKKLGDELVFSCDVLGIAGGGNGKANEVDPLGRRIRDPQVLKVGEGKPWSEVNSERGDVFQILIEERYLFVCTLESQMFDVWEERKNARVEEEGEGGEHSASGDEVLEITSVEIL